MRELTKTQMLVITTLIQRGAHGTAYGFEIAWKLGKQHFIEPRHGARFGLMHLIKKGNEEAKRTA
jgi:hypothetical protein